MFKCSNCGNSSSEESNYCSVCGALLKNHIFNEETSNDELLLGLEHVISEMSENRPKIKKPKSIITYKKNSAYYIGWGRDSNVDGYNIYIYKDKDGLEPVEHRQIYDVNKNYALYQPYEKKKKYYVCVSSFKIINNVVYESSCSKIKRLKKSNGKG